MNSPEATGETSHDAFYGGRFHLLQPRGWGYRAGLDALLLAASIPPGGGGRAVDLGAGTGAAGFALAAREAVGSLCLAERDPAMMSLASASLDLPENAVLRSRIALAEVDVLASRGKREASGLRDGAFWLAVSNPPFHPPGGRASPDLRRQAALAMPQPDFLLRWIAVAAALLEPGGVLALVARPDNLADILAGSANRLGDLRILPVHPVAGRPAKRILVHARKGSRAPLALLPGLALRDAASRPLPIEAEIAEGRATIHLGLL